MKNRSNQILEMLTKKNKMEVAVLAKELQVSQVTMRKDLDALESKGIIKREHGIASLCSSDDINGRIAYHYEEKKKIAMCASKLVSDGDTIMIESGSCCTLLADMLAATKKDLTIITNSAFIAEYIRKKSHFQMILLGGIYQHDAQVMVGPMVQQCVKNFYVDLLFIGTDGYSSKVGFTNRDQMRAQAVTDMSQQAERVVILTESEKFMKHGTVPIQMSDCQKTVVTDNKIDIHLINELEKKNIDVLIAE